MISLNFFCPSAFSFVPSCHFPTRSADQERHGGVGGGQRAHGGGHLRRRHRPGQHGGGRLLLPPAAHHQEAPGAAALLWREEDRRGGETRAASHPDVQGGLRLRLPDFLRPGDLRLQHRRDQVPGKIPRRPHLFSSGTPRSGEQWRRVCTSNAGSHHGTVRQGAWRTNFWHCAFNISKVPCYVRPTSVEFL